MPLKSDIELDATGLSCPEPLMLVRNQIREMEAKQVLYIMATDPTTKRDLDQFCRFMNHEMLESSCCGEILEFWIKKGS
jgi:tRNA 2-thiouridine synthesizing protein A